MDDSGRRDGLPRGHVLRQYCIEEQLGAGGFGITYLAYDTRLKRKVAIKELLPVDLAYRDETMTVRARKNDETDFLWAMERFKDEAITLAQFGGHPNIVNVVEHFEMYGTAYMVTSFEECLRLDQWLKARKQPLDKEAFERIFLPLLDALETIHKRNFLHRDIKPGNILICGDSEGNERPVLIDFGSARQAIVNRTVAVTSVLSPHWAPFELYQTNGNQGPWTDIYSMGAVMVYAFRGEKLPEVQDRIGNDSYQPLIRTHGAYYPNGLLRAIDHAVTPVESARPQSIAAWRPELKWPPIIPGHWWQRPLPLVIAAASLVVIASTGYVAHRNNWPFGFIHSHDWEDAKNYADQGKIGLALKKYGDFFAGDSSTEVKAQAREDLAKQIVKWQQERPDVVDKEWELIDPALPRLAKEDDRALELRGQFEANHKEREERSHLLEQADNETSHPKALEILADACDRFSQNSGTPAKRLLHRIDQINARPPKEKQEVDDLITVAGKIDSGQVSVSDTRTKEKVQGFVADLKQYGGDLKRLEEFQDAVKKAEGKGQWSDAICHGCVAAQIEAREQRVGSEATKNLDSLLKKLQLAGGAVPILDDAGIKEIHAAPELQPGLKPLTDLRGLENASSFKNFIDEEIKEISLVEEKIKKHPNPKILRAERGENKAETERRIKKNGENWEKSISFLTNLSQIHPRRSSPNEWLDNETFRTISEYLTDVDIESGNIGARMQEVEPILKILISTYFGKPSFNNATLIVAEAYTPIVFKTGGAVDEIETAKRYARNASEIVWNSATGNLDTRLRAAVLLCNLIANDFRVEILDEVEGLNSAKSLITLGEQIVSLSPNVEGKDHADMASSVVSKTAVQWLLNIKIHDPEQLKNHENALSNSFGQEGIARFLNNAFLERNKYHSFCFYLGVCYEEGWLKLDQDSDKAIAYYKEALSAWENKNPEGARVADRFRCRRFMHKALLKKANGNRNDPSYMTAMNLAKEGIQLQDPYMVFWVVNEEVEGGGKLDRQTIELVRRTAEPLIKEKFRDDIVAKDVYNNLLSKDEIKEQLQLPIIE